MCRIKIIQSGILKVIAPIVFNLHSTYSLDKIFQRVEISEKYPTTMITYLIAY